MHIYVTNLSSNSSYVRMHMHTHTHINIAHAHANTELYTYSACIHACMDIIVVAI